MNNLTVKAVPFMGNELMAARDEDTGKIYAGVSYICKGIGLTEKQKDNEVSKIQKDLVLRKGEKKLPLKFEGQVREIQCIEIDFIPLWLAKISITPAMQRERPEAADKLVQYQLKTQKVLAAAFLPRAAKQLESVDSLNGMAKIILPVFASAGMRPEFQALALKQIYRRAGIDLPVDGLKTEREFYDLSTIARMSGIFSRSGKPHEKAAGAIIRELEISEDEREIVTFEKNGHQGTTYQYSQAVADKVKQWVMAHGYPDSVRGGGRNSYIVCYSSQPALAS